jgi:hypothetical protein
MDFRRTQMIENPPDTSKKRAGLQQNEYICQKKQTSLGPLIIRNYRP